MKKLEQEFYNKSAIELAPRLIGKLLCRSIYGNILKFRISETEIYYGESDTACHAHRGKTKRNEIIYRQGGITYVYLCYGIHYLLNIVTGPENHPEGVLIRGVDKCFGPGKVTKLLEVDKSLNGISLTTSDEIWLEDDGYIPELKLLKRVGIGYASEEDQNKLWRFIDKKQ